VRTLAGRYRIEDRVLDGAGWTLWTATDGALHRPVAVISVDPGHAHLDDVREAARSAARADDPRLQRVLDIVEDDERTCLVVEWHEATGLERLLADGPLPEAEARRLVGEVASALSRADDQGLHHGRLAPRWVQRTEDGRVRVAGVELLAALDGRRATWQRPEDAAAADARGLGALLYAALTGRWPGEPADCALPAAPRIGDRPIRARGVLAGVPPVLDDITARALGLTERGALTTPGEVARALESAQGRLVPVELDREAVEDPPPLSGSTRPGPLAVVAVTVTAVVAAAALALGVLAWTASTRDQPAAAGSTTSAPSSGASTALLGGPIPIVSVRDFDPAGNGQENPELAPLAIDGKPSTAWRTVFYDRADLGGLKPGVGLLLDLGAPTPIGAVRVELVGRGTDIELRAASIAPVTADDAITVAQAKGAGDLVTLRPDPQVDARYLLLWLTKLPKDGDRYRGGVSEVQVLRN
jgi:hypothetical protein